ncbi:MAG: biotin synthase BioB [Bacteroidia bacterium]|nr:biotin synthase BioB [Bacteroidia bacterium]
MNCIRYDWTFDEIQQVYHKPLLELIFQAAVIHRQYHNPSEVQVCKLLSIKTGGCPEDCAYCPQAARYDTGISVHKLLDVETVLREAVVARSNGATRFCMGASWREVRDNKDFDKVLEMIRGVHSLGLEVCCTLGMVTEEQAKKMKEAGLYAYNHNLDTSEEFYTEIISTRTYEDRLQTLDNVRKASISVCCGGIIGMGETVEDRIKMLLTLAKMNPHPESVPVNALVAVPGTPLEHQPKVPWSDMVRMIATARITIPKAMIRLSAGRVRMSSEEQALCFLAGANSIFAGDKLLTTANNSWQSDSELFALLGLKAKEPYSNEEPVLA